MLIAVAVLSTMIARADGLVSSGHKTLQLRGGAFLEDANQRRGHCAETGSWLGTYGLPHTDAHNLTVVFPTDTQHALKIGKGASWPPKVENGYQIDNEFLVEDAWLQRQPLVDWDKEWGKCCLVMLDPDAPRPRSEELGGSACGSFGPWLHWLVVDAVGTPEHGTTLVEHMGPAPPQGRHRKERNAWSS